MFTTDAIVLKKSEIREGEFLYHLFTKDFGKIRVWANKKKYLYPLDHGSVLHGIIHTKNSKNTLENAKVSRAIRSDHLDYRSLTNILLCLKSILILHPDGTSNTGLFEDYLTSLPFFEQSSTNDRSVEFFLLKIFKTSGFSYERKQTESQDFQKIYRHIDHYPLKTFHSIRGVSEAVMEEIRQANRICIASYLS